MINYLFSSFYLQSKQKVLEDDSDCSSNSSDISDYEEIYLSNSLKNQDNLVDPRERVEGFIQLLCKNYKRYYLPKKNIVIDENLLYYRGRQKLKFYIPAKPHKWGFKIHLLCDSINNYVYNVLFDPRKEGKNFIMKEALSYTESIIFNLIEEFENRNHTLFLNSWYSSVNFVRMLKEKGFNSTGILKNNLKIIPKDD